MKEREKERERKKEKFAEETTSAVTDDAGSIGAETHKVRKSHCAETPRGNVALV